jgi:hypothetical protein
MDRLNQSLDLERTSNLPAGQLEPISKLSTEVATKLVLPVGASAYVQACQLTCLVLHAPEPPKVPLKVPQKAEEPSKYISL